MIRIADGQGMCAWCGGSCVEKFPKVMEILRRDRPVIIFREMEAPNSNFLHRYCCGVIDHRIAEAKTKH